MWKVADTSTRVVYESVCHQRAVLFKAHSHWLTCPPLLCHVSLNESLKIARLLLMFFFSNVLCLLG
jgi:hypothetical protein